MIEKLRLRARILAKIRGFFASRGVLEVETPLLYPSTIPSPYIHSFAVPGSFRGGCKAMYLQTSPEFAMKRLLASGSGDVYQICKAFRDEEQGRLHNPEFTILEWYRVGFDHQRLMDEMDELLQFVLHTSLATRASYQEIFLQHLQIDPLEINVAKLREYAQKKGLNMNILSDLDKDTLLQILLNQFIEPHLGKNNAPFFLYDFPATQAALARISKSDARVAERFEVYIDGIELANGFHELTNEDEQRQRFVEELQMRAQMNLPQIPLDEDFLQALPSLPDCAGVALGIDRLLLIAARAQSLQDVLALE